MRTVSGSSRERERESCWRAIGGVGVGGWEDERWMVDTELY